jgi:phosphate-selective porin OprO/OprP
VNRCLACLLLSLLAAPPVAAGPDEKPGAGKASFDQQLLDELRSKGVIGEEAYERLREAAAKEPTGSPLLAGYDKGFFIRSKDDLFALKINGLGQFRYTYFDKDQDASPTAEDKSSFRNRRIRVKLSGHAFRPWVTYALQWENAGSSLSLRDYFVDLYDRKALPEIGLRFGQFKTPFTRQFLISSQNLIFTERAITNDATGIDFAFDRDQGVALHGKPLGDLADVEYTTGLFNGNGQNQPDNPDVGLLWVSRIDWNVLGDPGYSEGDLEGSPDPRWAVGANYGYNVVTPTSGPLGGVDISISRFGIDTILKFMGWSLQGEYFASNEAPERRVPADPTGGVNAKGGYVQASYFLLPKELDVAVRYAYFDRDRAGEPDRQELIGGVHYYFAGHPWKLQADVRRLTIARDPGVDNREIQVILQAQVSF